MNVGIPVISKFVDLKYMWRLTRGVQVNLLFKVPKNDLA